MNDDWIAGVRLTLICHGATAATRIAAFPRDEPLETAAYESAKSLRRSLPKVGCSWTSPALRARQTAEALALEAHPHTALRDCDYGRWAGRTLKEVEATEPEAVRMWLSDFAAAPHGGERLADLFERVSEWIDSALCGDDDLIVVTHAAVIRATLIHLLGAPRDRFWQLDIEPLSFVGVRGDRQRPRLRIARGFISGM